MGAANEAIVTLVHTAFWSEDGPGLLQPYEGEYVSAEESARIVTSHFGDRVAETVMAAWKSPPIRDILESIEDAGDFDEMLDILRAAMQRENLLG